MNADQLKNQIGAILKLRPLPFRLWALRRMLPPRDDDWRLEAILKDPTRVRLVNTSTGHVLELQSDNVREYRSPNFLILRCQLTISLSGIAIEPILGQGAV